MEGLGRTGANPFGRIRQLHESAMERTQERLASGRKDGKAALDPALIPLVARFAAQMGETAASIETAETGVNLARTADAAAAEVESRVQDLRALAVRAADESFSGETVRGIVQAEAQTILDSITTVAESTQFNGKNLLDGTFDGSFQTPMGSAELAIDSMASGLLGTSGGASPLSGVDLRTQEGSSLAIEVADRALADVARARSSLGRFEADVLRPAIEHGRVELENLAAADSTAADTDYGEETSLLRRLEVQSMAMNQMQRLHQALSASRVERLLGI